MGRVGTRLRRYLITGLIVIAPVGVTAYVLVWLFEKLDAIFGVYLPPIYGRRTPGLGLLLLLVVLLAVGWASQRALGARLLAWWNALLSRIPFTRKIYTASSQIVQTLLDRDEKVFQSCALIEYPRPGCYSIAFITARAPGEVEGHVGERSVSLFLPTVPNPTSGYLLILPESRVTPLAMSVEEGFKMILSAGVVVPGEERGPGAGLDLARLRRIGRARHGGEGGASGG